MTSKPLRRLCWVLGSLTVSSSIAESAYLSHTKGYAESEVKAMNNAQQVQMINGLGMMLLATRKHKVIILPFSALLFGTVCFSGLIFYSKSQKDFRFNQLIPMGGAASIAGWALIAIC